MKKLWNKLWNTLRGDGQLCFGVIGILVLLFIVVAAPVLTSQDPYFYGPDSLAAPGVSGHLLGTNHMGQDVMSMLLYGVRTSLMVAVVSSLISGVLGVLIGGLGGYFGGKVDLVVSEIINIFLMIPTFFLIMLIISLFGSNIKNVMIVIGITTWSSNAKLMRAQALSLRERTFVKSAIALGETRFQVLFKYILPNGIFPRHRQHHPRHGRSNPDGGVSVLPGSGGPQHHLLGPDDLPGQGVHHQFLVGLHVLRYRHHHHRYHLLYAG